MVVQSRSVVMASHARSHTAGSVSGTTTRPTTTTSRPHTGSRSRPRTSRTSTGYSDNEIICAISESRGISPTIGLSFVNISTVEAVLCQFADTQTYARTCHKIKVFAPSEILFINTAEDSKLISIVKENIVVENGDVGMRALPRRYWSEISGHEYVQYLAFPDDLESLKLAISGNFFATCCFSAVWRKVSTLPTQC
jgi:DNA mismatch repair protein MSH4